MTKPPTIRPVRTVMSGNPPFAPYRMGWYVSLCGRATREENAWLKAKRFVFSGARWWKRDAGEYVSKVSVEAVAGMARATR